MKCFVRPEKYQICQYATLALDLVGCVYSVDLFIPSTSILHSEIHSIPMYIHCITFYYYLYKPDDGGLSVVSLLG